MSTVEITESHTSRVGEFEVRRALPRKGRRMIGAWCFIDHMGPTTVDERGLGVAPHPHIGLQTVTWLLAGEALHRDSLGSEQIIAPDQLNLMTAGQGVSHSEEGTSRSAGALHGVQFWVAQPEATRNGPAAFEHYPELPVLDIEGAVGTVLIGEFAGVRSPARRDTDHAGVDLDLRPGTVTIPLRPDYEHGLVVLTGATTVDGETLTPGHLAYLAPGRDEIALTSSGPTRAALVGGVPFGEQIIMWWNYVARTRDEITVAHDEWTAGTERFGHVDSALPRYLTGPPPWRTG